MTTIINQEGISEWDSYQDYYNDEFNESSTLETNEISSEEQKEEIEITGKSHRFVWSSCTQAAFCAVCFKFIWSSVRENSAYQCRDCHQFPIHKDCWNNAPMNCTAPKRPLPQPRISLPPQRPQPPPPLPKSKPPSKIFSRSSSAFFLSQVPPPLPKNPPPSKRPSSDQVKGRPSWKEAFTSTGQRYYYNEITGESSWESPSVSQVLASDQVHSTREKVVSEILDTEQNYCKDLTWILVNLVKPLEAETSVTPEEREKVFGNIEILYKVNLEILDGLRTNSMIGQIFIEKAEKIKQVYSEYCSNLDASILEIIRLKKENSAFSRLCENFRFLEESRLLDISDFLIKPFQRICKYPLLFKELLKYTNNEDQRKHLSIALNILQDITKHIDEQKNKSDKIRRMKAIESKLVNAPKGFSITDNPSREYIQEETFQVSQKINHIYTKSKQIIFLFSDSMLFTELKSDDVYQYKGFVILDNFIELKRLSNKEEGEYKYRFLIRDKKKEKFYKLASKSSETIEQWMADVYNAIFSHYEITKRRMSTSQSFYRTSSFGSDSGSEDNNSPNISKSASLTDLSDYSSENRGRSFSHSQMSLRNGFSQKIFKKNGTLR